MAVAVTAISAAQSAEISSSRCYFTTLLGQADHKIPKIGNVIDFKFLGSFFRSSLSGLPAHTM